MDEKYIGQGWRPATYSMYADEASDISNGLVQAIEASRMSYG